MNTTLVIMAAGMGSRFGGGIKQLEPLGPNKETLMLYSIYDAIKVGFNKVVFVTREELLPTFKEMVGNVISNHIKVEYVFQKLEDLPKGFETPKEREKPWGTGQAILSCKEVVKEPFLVINADDYYGQKAFKLIYDFLNSSDKKENIYNFCMAGFVLGNTLSDNGTVTRGVCEVCENGYLTKVTETENIIKENESAFVLNGEDKISIDKEKNVSMNMWGFTEEIFEELENGFVRFLKDENTNLLKNEFLLPQLVDELINEDKACVKVLETDDKWFGVTYQEDKELVKEALKNLVENKVYPNNLFK